MLLVPYLVAGVLGFSSFVQSASLPTATDELDSFATTVEKRAKNTPCGKYYDVKLGPRLGQGTHGRVYRARGHESKLRPAEKVAVKVSKSKHDDMAAWMLQGAQTALQHFDRSPYMMKILATCKVDDFPWVVSERLNPDDDLSARIEDGYYRQHPEEIATVASQMMAGLAYMHGKGYCYNDVKPGNLMVDGSNVKYVDFDMVSRGLPTKMCGTPGWMSPGEFALMFPVDPSLMGLEWMGFGGKRPDCYANDIWAAGVSLVELVKSRSLWTDGKSERAEMLVEETNVDERAKLIKRWDSRLSTAFCQWLAKHFFAAEKLRSSAATIQLEFQHGKVPPYFSSHRARRDVVADEDHLDMPSQQTICLHFNPGSGSNETSWSFR